ncbi:MAG: hypothetical protein IPM59_09635 [Chloracidobacterium sp.]|nr:hypothetical protein [Chloracidobacterium sp.]
MDKVTTPDNKHRPSGAMGSANLSAAKSMEYALDGIVRNVYANDPGKLAAWISASHVEKAPKKQTPTS